MKNTIFASLVFMLMLFGGCAQKTPEVEPVTSVATPEVQTPQQEIENINTMDHMDNMSVEQMPMMTQSEKIAKLEGMLQSIYFEFDKYYIPIDLQLQMQENASILNSPEAKDFSVKIEGNCDEWGTDEYNYALGLKRAKSVKDALVALGVSADRMSLVSYGESKPICFEKNEACWQKNRRVDFKLLP